MTAATTKTRTLEEKTFAESSKSEFTFNVVLSDEFSIANFIGPPILCLKMK